MKALSFLLLCAALIARAHDPLEILRKSAQEAARLYPEAAVEGSPFYNRMIEIEKRLIVADDPLVNDPNKPLIIAKQADAELKAEIVAAKVRQLYPEFGNESSRFMQWVRAYERFAKSKHPGAFDVTDEQSMIMACSCAADALEKERQAKVSQQQPVSANVTTGTAQGIIAAGGRAPLWQPSDPTQDKLDAIKQQLDMQAAQQKLDAFRQHQIENAEQFRRTVERLQR